MRCPSCHAPIRPEDVFCGSCGYKLTPQDRAGDAAPVAEQPSPFPPMPGLPPLQIPSYLPGTAGSGCSTDAMIRRPGLPWRRRSQHTLKRHRRCIARPNSRCTRQRRNHRTAHRFLRLLSPRRRASVVV